MLFGPAWPLPALSSKRFVPVAVLLTVVAAAGCVGSIPDPEPEMPDPGDGTQPGPPGQTGSAPGDTTVPVGACKAEPPPARIWRLSDQQYRNVVGELLPGVDVPEITTPG